MPNSKRDRESRSGARRSVLVLFTLLAVLGAEAHADPQSQQALLKAQALLKQVAQQKSAAEAELTKIKTEAAIKDKALAKLQGDLNAQAAALNSTRADLASSAREGSSLEHNLAQTRARLTSSQDKLRKVIQRYKDTAARLRASETETAVTAEKLQGAVTELQDADAKNQALYAINRELVEKYQHKSVWAWLLQHEPVTGLKDVQIENEVQDVEDKLIDQVRNHTHDAN